MVDTISSEGLKMLWRLKVNSKPLPKDWKLMVDNYLGNKRIFMKAQKCGAEWVQQYIESVTIARNLGIEVKQVVF